MRCSPTSTQAATLQLDPSRCGRLAREKPTGFGSLVGEVGPRPLRVAAQLRLVAPRPKPEKGSCFFDVFNELV